MRDGPLAGGVARENSVNRSRNRSAVGCPRIRVPSFSMIFSLWFPVEGTSANVAGWDLLHSYYVTRSWRRYVQVTGYYAIVGVIASVDQC